MRLPPRARRFWRLSCLKVILPPRGPKSFSYLCWPRLIGASSLNYCKCECEFLHNREYRVRIILPHCSPSHSLWPSLPICAGNAICYRCNILRKLAHSKLVINGANIYDSLGPSPFRQKLMTSCSRSARRVSLEWEVNKGELELLKRNIYYL